MLIRGVSLACGFCVVFLWMSRAEAQFGPLVSPGQAAQARSEDEFDHYLEIVTATDPMEVVTKANAFVTLFSGSELLGQAYQHEAEAFARLDNFEGMLTAGRKALLASGDNLNTLLMLAPAMADRAGDRPDRTTLLSGAEDYAHRALELIDKTRIPHSVSLQDWLLKKRQMQSKAHEVLGVVAFQRGQSQSAIRELQTAVLFSPEADGAQYYKLGLAFAAAGQKKDAQANLRHSAQLGPDSIRKLALEKLNKLQGIDVDGDIN